MSRLLAILLWWIAVLLIVIGVAVNLLGVMDLSLSVWIGGGLLALGLNVLIAGDLVITSASRPASTRSDVSRAILDVRAGLSNMDIRAGDDERLAGIRIGASSSPQITVVDGVAHLLIANRLSWLPTAANWRADLATNVLWDVNARSSIGHLDIDLRSVRVDSVSLRSYMGDIRLQCPRRGRTRLKLETSLGDVEVKVPPQAGALIKVSRGNMAVVSIIGSRFEQLDDNTFATLNVDEASAVAEISLSTRAGEVRLG